MHEDALLTAGLAVGRTRVLRGGDAVGFLLLTGLTWVALAWCFTAWVTQADWRQHPWLLGSLTLLLVYTVAGQQFRWWLLLGMRRPLPRPARPGWRVGVATTFVPGAEALEMLAETLQALVALDYPHDTWVLDEGDDVDVKALCARLGVRHFSRRGVPAYQTAEGRFQARTKHGNYNAWLAASGCGPYDLLLNIDPDHVPTPTFLREVLGYFDDPRIGYVQVAQAYYNQGASFIARGAAEETYDYYAATQMASAALGFPIVTGCHTVHRVAALQQVGGFAPHDADDLLITVLYRRAGWHGVYLPQILARGLTPVDWTGYLTQQRRWARSVLDIKCRVYPRLAGGLPWRERLLGALHGLYYLQGLATGAGLGLLAVMLASGCTPQFLTDGMLWRVAGLYAVLQGTEFYRQRFFLGGRAERGLHWRAGLLQLAKWPYLGLALLDVVLNRTYPYQLTRKVRTAGTRHLVVRAHLPVVLLLGLAWGVGLAAGHPLPGILHLWTAGLILVFLALMATDWWHFPPPYDRRLWEGQRGGKAPTEVLYLVKRPAYQLVLTHHTSAPPGPHAWGPLLRLDFLRDKQTSEMVLDLPQLEEFHHDVTRLWEYVESERARNRPSR
ncbi:MAG TPA: glycosyltransferase [Candidatus Tectomicrobia bacterium]|nr:glycosyltransferase [Candidatus Tectomicrobia bacterium]